MSSLHSEDAPSHLQAFRKNPGYHCHRLLDKVLFQCADDPVTNVHRTWAVLLFSLVLYWVLSILEAIHLSGHGATALLLAALWNGTLQCLGLGGIGTFILKRFPTSFAIGFLLGLVVVCFHQNILFFFAVRKHNRPDVENDIAPSATSRLYNACSLWLALLLAVFGIMLFHFQQHIIVAPIDAKGFGRKTPTAEASTYQRYDDDGAGSES